ncbi:MAG: Gfo/Idh/MocA family protein [Alphaproteobacteria bacterium]
MRTIVVGIGVQGEKRCAVAGSDVVATVDPCRENVDYRSVADVPLSDYDAALVCVPDQAKEEILSHLLRHGKHVLVEKPLLFPDNKPLEHLAQTARANGAVCYTAYNHRFEPHFVRMRDLIAGGSLGQIYSVRMFYGNGTARLVRNSPWRDQGAGVLPDLGSHLLDTLLFWLGDLAQTFELWSANRFENQSFDHISFGAQARDTLPLVQLEATLLSWHNHFYCDVFAENGSAHITSLCKWGPSSFMVRHRVLPSGRPDEEVVTLSQPDPTWAIEYAHFCSLASGDNPAEAGNIGNDMRINNILNDIAARAFGGGGV